jgi:hypothetical protein
MRAGLILLFACAAMATNPPQRIAGSYQVTLRLPEGGLYAQEEMQIEFRVEDTTRPDPVTGFTAVVRAAPDTLIDMPAMPKMPPFTEVAHAEGVPGDYGIHPTFAHGGDFRLRVAVHPPGAEAFTVEFPLEVGDAAQGKRKPPPPRYRLDIIADPKKPKAGQPVSLSLVVHDRDNGIVRQFDTMHERPLHLVVVRRDLAHFRHEHPSLEADGSFHLAYTFAAAGEYRLFADLAPKGAGGQILSAHLNVAGGGSEAPDASEPADTKAEIVAPTGPLPVRKTVPLEFLLRDARSGEPPSDLEPYLGVAGHLMLLEEDAATFVHVHPDDSGSLRFLARFPKPGVYRGWLQVQRAGAIRTFEFVFHAEETR